MLEFATAMKWIMWILLSVQIGITEAKVGLEVTIGNGTHDYTNVCLLKAYNGGAESMLSNKKCKT